MTRITLVLFFLGAACTVLAQDSLSWRRLITGNTKIHSLAAKPKLKKHIDKFKPIVLVMDTVKEKNYFNGYILNCSDTALLIQHIDGALDDLSTEVFVDGEWKIWQSIDRSGVWCGNSYFPVELPANHYKYFRIYYETAGKIKVPFRVKYIFEGEAYYSGSFMINATPEQLKHAGRPVIAAIHERIYKDLIWQADYCFSLEDYENAIKLYGQALAIKPGETMPITRMKEAEKRLADSIKDK
jgi:tetratricopeptide (TPR) repeat protein